MPLSESLNDKEFIEYCDARVFRRVPFFRGEEINRLCKLVGDEPIYKNVEGHNPFLVFPGYWELEETIQLIRQAYMELEKKEKVVDFPIYRKGLKIVGEHIFSNDAPIVISLDNGNQLIL